MTRFGGFRGIGRWRIGWGIPLACLLAAAGTSSVRAGASFGFHAGWTDQRGDIFRGSGKLGTTNLFGLQASFPLMPMVSLSLAGEAKNDSAHFNAAGDAFNEFGGRADWDDVALFASLRLRLVPLSTGPFNLYGGGGVGVHFTKITILPAPPLTKISSAGRRPVPQEIGEAAVSAPEFILQTEEKQTNISLHALAGASLGLPVFPLSVFAEGRLEQTTGSYKPRGFTIYGGLDLNHP